MRHQIAGRKLGRTTSHRKAMLRNLVTSLLEHERVKTTDAKAKELRPLAEKMIGLGKRGDLHARRQVLAVVRKADVVRKLFDTLSLRYQVRNGGYVRIVKIGYRPGDGAPVSIVELVTEGKEARVFKRRRAGKRRSKEKGVETGKPATPSSKV
ncbi:MAG: 50S ribosomal protein L17 [Deltaproteobacteria bacterium RBG_19FT_COMBO_52_11]|nr:MAG: 50S ribosomal protein L17 [Deltaproteobacteria bacterium RBG_19FT_COMBO_52_11]